MKNVTSLLLMLVMLGVFIQSSQAIRCYQCEGCEVSCDGCDQVTSDTGYCSDEVCVTLITIWGAFRKYCCITMNVMQ